jgi:hypothetical protein
MEFEKFKKHIERIRSTHKREEELSKCIEKNLATSTYCIVDLSSEVEASVVELLADYYDCHFEIQEHLDNEISWWLYEDVEKKIYIKGNGNEKEIDITNIKDFWRYLEDNKKSKIDKLSK